MTLRPYQLRSADAIINHVRRSTAPCLIEAATGAGKSHIIAHVAQWLHKHSGKRVLCTAPSAELVTQNREKYLATGNPASIFSATAGGKCLKHPVIFGTPLTIKNSVEAFDARYCAVIIDEAHGITPTIRELVDAMRTANKNLRIIGMTATPYRMGDGYIYGRHGDTVLSDDYAAEPFFAELVDRITAQELIQMGYLTAPLAHDPATHYDTSALERSSTGSWTADSVDRAFTGQGRLTAEIVAEVVELSRDRLGVMFFAASIKHAQEVLASLPPALARLVTGETSAAERAKVVSDFKSRKFKYLVNVAVFTTGFDAPHVDVIALLRRTESAALLQQIIGRGLRLSDGKQNCLILDYAENISNQELDDDIFSPKIRAKKNGEPGMPISARCPLCSVINKFAARPNPDGYAVDEFGYCLDLTGAQLPLPAHFGRRCWGADRRTGERCGYRWTLKICDHCAHENDIAARYCEKCRGELVDPNEKLVRDFKRMKRDPSALSTDAVIHADGMKTLSRKGDEIIRVDIRTEYRTFPAWFTPTFRKKWVLLCRALDISTDSTPAEVSILADWSKIKTVSAKKDGDFFTIFAFNEPEDAL